MMYLKSRRNSGNIRVQPEKESEGGDSTGLSKIVEVRSGAALAGCKQCVTIRPRYKAARRGGSRSESRWSKSSSGSPRSTHRIGSPGLGLRTRSVRPLSRGCRFWVLVPLSRGGGILLLATHTSARF